MSCGMSLSWAGKPSAEGDITDPAKDSAHKQLRCSEYRGSTVPFTSCLNLTVPQFAIGQATAPAPIGRITPFQPRLGPSPVVQMQNYQPARASNTPIQIMRNPARAAPANSHMEYGSAAKGVRPPAATTQATPMAHHDRLQSMLLGPPRLLADQQAVQATALHQYGARSPVNPQVGVPNLAKPPPRPTAAINGTGGVPDGANGHLNGDIAGVSGPRGRGLHSGRGRGRRAGKAAKVSS